MPTLFPFHIAQFKFRSCAHPHKQALVRDLRLRETQIHRLEAENAALTRVVVAAAIPGCPAAVTPVTLPQADHQLRQESAGSITPMNGEAREGSLTRSEQASNTCASQASLEGGNREDCRRRSASNGEEQRSTEASGAGTRESHEGIEVKNRLEQKDGGSKADGRPAEEVSRSRCNTTTTAAPSDSVIVRKIRKQLTPQAAVIPGRRVAPISYPRRGSRVTLVPPEDGDPPEEDRNWQGSEPEAIGNGESDTVVVKTSGDAPSMDVQDAVSEKMPPGLTMVPPQQPSDGRQIRPTPEPPLPRRPSDRLAACTYSTAAACVDDTVLHLEGLAPVGVTEEKGAGGETGLGGDTERRGHANGVADEQMTTSVRPSNNDVFDDRESEMPGARPSTCVAEVGHGGTSKAHVESSMPLRREEHPVTDGILISRLVEGVSVLKYGGGGGKPKAKMLWATPDLSGIFYTRVGK